MLYSAYVINHGAAVTLPELARAYATHNYCLRPGTVYLHFRACDSLNKYHGRIVRVRELSQETLLPWLRNRLEEAKPWTVRRERASILALWRYAHSAGLHPTLPDSTLIPAVRLPRKTPTAWWIADFERLLASCSTKDGLIKGTDIAKADWWKSFCLTMYDTGARPSAALKIKTANADLAAAVVVLAAEESKTNSDAVCGLSSQTVAAIAKIYDPSREFLFPWPYCRRWLWRESERIRKQAGLPVDRYHSWGCMRRTTASYAARCGSLETARRMLGHANVQMTIQNYIDPRIAEAESAVSILPRPRIA